MKKESNKKLNMAGEAEKKAQLSGKSEKLKLDRKESDENFEEIKEKEDLRGGRAEMIDFADPLRIGLNKQIALALVETGQNKVANFNSQDNIMLRKGEKESFERDLNEELKKIEKLIDELEYSYQANKNLSPEDGSIMGYNIYLSKRKEDLEAFLRAREEGNNKEAALLLGCPEAAANAYGTKEAFQDFEKEIPFQEYQKIREEGLLRFINFQPSRKHWREEIECVRKWQGEIRKKFPILAGVIPMIERDDLIEEAENYLKNNLTPEVKKIIFEKYNGLIDTADKSSVNWIGSKNENKIMEQVLAEAGEDTEKFRKQLKKFKKENLEAHRELFIKEEKFSGEGLKAIFLSSLTASQDFLIEIYKKVKQAESQGREIDEDEILKTIEEYGADLRLRAAVHKSLKKALKSGEIRPEDLKDIISINTSIDSLMSDRARNVFGLICDQARSSGEFRFIPGTSVKGLLRKYIDKYKANLDENDKNSIDEVVQMIDIYSKNYETNPALQEKLLESFTDKIRNGGAGVNLHTYRYKGQIIAFNRFDQGKGKEKYFGSFNVLTEIAGSGMGNALLEASLEEETSNNETIKADCLPGVTITSSYIERWGFVVKNIVRDYQGTGETVFSIERLPGQTEYKYKDYGPEKLILEAEYSAGEQKDNGAMVLKFKRNSPELIDVSEELINGKGYVMTRYLFEGENVYCAFERGGN